MGLLKDARETSSRTIEEEDAYKGLPVVARRSRLERKSAPVLEICLLGAMGMSDDEIQELVSNFEPYLDWRMETSIEFMNEYLKKCGSERPDLSSRQLVPLGKRGHGQSICRGRYPSRHNGLVASSIPAGSLVTQSWMSGRAGVTATDLPSPAPAVSFQRQATH